MNEIIENFTAVSATYDIRDNKLRIYPSSRLSNDEYKLVNEKMRFKWAPKQKCFYAIWTPYREDFILSVCDSIDDEDKTPEDRAAERAERFEKYSENRSKDAEAAYKTVKEIQENIPLGQPILVGHHSERRHRRDLEKMDNAMSKACNAWDTSEYWERRAKASLSHVAYKERPDVRYRRIKKLEAEARKYQRNIDEHNKLMKMWNAKELTHEHAVFVAGFSGHPSFCFPLDKYPRPPEKSQYEGSMSLWNALKEEIITAEQAKTMTFKAFDRWDSYYQRFINHLNNRILFEKTMLGDTVGCAMEERWPDMQVNGFVMVNRVMRGGWLRILKVNRKNGVITSVRAKDETRDETGKYLIEEITDYKAPEAGSVQEKILTCNYPGEGIIEMTFEEWKKIGKDYKSVRSVSENGVVFKIRRAMRYPVTSCQVYLTDKKIVRPPVPVATQKPEQNALI